MKVSRCNVEAVLITHERLVFRDVGPWSTFKTVTNDVENFVAKLYEDGALEDETKLFYFDSEDELTEILHEKGIFKGFREYARETK